MHQPRGVGFGRTYLLEGQLDLVGSPLGYHRRVGSSNLRASPGGYVNLHPDAGNDIYLWKIGDGVALDTFSTSKTWSYLNPLGPRVTWYEAVWFKGRIPRHAFIVWLNSRHRLHTRDRLRSWGLVVPPICLLCNTHDESCQHLFFDCVYSSEIWLYFTTRAHVSPTVLFEDGITWLKNPCQDENTALILRLACQASVYILWKERNSLIHTNTFITAPTRLLEVKSIIRCHLDPLSRAQRISSPSDSFLVTWCNSFRRHQFVKGFQPSSIKINEGCAKF
ncbi:PREDICTED: uncharacterized protein LOC109132451 [Camelina sativa]|uniref:Uncharacterized protein LOC109132451 n=1 Tax=Camelina sativa TaxID=90675 RepID=A0ABM1RKS0_CAMSA|nr:PREDICTED: uncharacterized protein LOC109132451 [Camelina sativa]